MVALRAASLMAMPLWMQVSASNGSTVAMVNTIGSACVTIPQSAMTISSHLLGARSPSAFHSG